MVIQIFSELEYMRLNSKLFQIFGFLRLFGIAYSCFSSKNTLQSSWPQDHINILECYRLIALMIIAGRAGLVGSGIVTQCLSLARSVSLVFSVSRWGILWIILKSCRYLYQVLKLDISLMEMSVMVRISNL